MSKSESLHLDAIGAQKALQTINNSLTKAARLKQQGVVERALEMGADPNCTDAFGLTVLHLASKSNDIRMIEMLIRHGARVNNTGQIGISAIGSAALSGHIQALELLSSHELDLEPSQDQSQGILELTLSLGQFEVSQWLMDHGSDVECVDRFGSSLLMRMILKNNHQAANLLALNAACVDDDVMSLVRKKEFTGNINIFKTYHRPGHIVYRLHYWQSPEDVSSLQVEQIEEIGDIWDDDVQHPTDVTTQEATKQTRIGLEKLKNAITQTKQKAQVLIGDLRGFGVYPKSFDVARKTHQFLKLLQDGHFVKACELLGNNAAKIDINSRAIQAMTALQLLVLAMIQRGPRQTEYQKTLSITEDVVLEIVQKMQAKGIDRSHSCARFSDTGNTVLHELINNGWSKLCFELIKLPAFKMMINLSNYDLDRPLHLSVKNRCVDLMAPLVKAGGNINAFNRSGDTPLHLAADMLEFACAETAIWLGANVYLPTKEGVTIEQIMARNKDKSDALRGLVHAQKTINASKSIFSFNNPLCGAVRLQQNMPKKSS